MLSTQETIPEKKVRKSKKAQVVEQPPVLETIQEEPEPKPKTTRKRVVKKVETPAPAPVPTPEPKAPKKQSAWFQALKKWNQGREKYSIPKKDTPEYAEIQKLMGGLSI